jgi:hypothetical protein
VDYGVNFLLTSLHITEPIGWIVQADTALSAVIIKYLADRTTSSCEYGIARPKML